MTTPGTPDRSSKVSLREVTEETVRDICKLSVTEAQTKFVAPNAVSMAQAHFSDYAWFRGIYADDTPVGFVMLDDRPHEAFCFLWRFMIDARFQGHGYGREALQLILQHIKARPRTATLLTSVVQADGGPQPFYEKLGFVLTGDVVDGEAVLALALDDSVKPAALPSELLPRLVPMLLTNDMSATLAFYHKLGFVTHRQSPPAGDPTWVELKRDSIRLQFDANPSGSTPTPTTCSGTFCLYTHEFDGLVRELEGKVEFASVPEDEPSGQRQFGIRDPNGYRLVFCERPD